MTILRSSQNIHVQVHVNADESITTQFYGKGTNSKTGNSVIVMYI